MKPPKSRKQVRTSIYVLHYYHDIWLRQSHMLAPLTRLIYIKNKFEWTKIKQDTSDKIN